MHASDGCGTITFFCDAIERRPFWSIRAWVSCSVRSEMIRQVVRRFECPTRERGKVSRVWAHAHTMIGLSRQVCISALRTLNQTCIFATRAPSCQHNANSMISMNSASRRRIIENQSASIKISCIFWRPQFCRPYLSWSIYGILQLYFNCAFGRIPRVLLFDGSGVSINLNKTQCSVLRYRYVIHRHENGSFRARIHVKRHQPFMP